MIKNFDSVCYGLPENYESAARYGFKRASLDSVKIDLNRINIFFAAYGEVSSSERIFEKIGFVLANLIVGKYDDRFKRKIAPLFEID
ncbi:hypothetical protein VRB53_00755 [Pseudomonas trivialis]|uniref:hypothetical protein n=1 Tax=Pseudomonas trivialis TaxID=200450 RepID=UPI0030D4AC9B